MGDKQEGLVRKSIQDAAAMVKDLPESLQAAAFSKAFDALMNVGNVQRTEVFRALPPARAGKRHGRSRVATGIEDGEGAMGASTLNREVNRTEHPEIRDGRKALDLALLILQAGRKHGVEWLTPSDISGVLAEKFMIRSDPPAIRMALGTSKFVDRRPARRGKGYEYRLMAPGESYLNRLSDHDRKAGTAS
jgi:hypothetical protein